jgi:hypothetical protein
MKKIMTVVLFFLFCGSAFATAQFPDILVYKGEKLPVYSNPLESYFNKDNPRPKDLFIYSCTAVWRGYVASWKIEDGYLYLTKLVEGTCSSNAPEIPITRIFPGKEAPVKAVWFSGTLRVPMGKQLRYVHMGYGSIYEKDLFLSIENGKVVKESIIDNTKKRLPSEEERAREELDKLKQQR